MSKDKHSDSSLPNLEVIQEFRNNGEAVRVGSVIAKSSLPESVWKNLLHMKPPRVSETKADLKTVAKPKTAEKTEGGDSKDNGKSTGKMPGA